MNCMQKASLLAFVAAASAGSIAQTTTASSNPDGLQKVIIPFAAKVGDQPFACGQVYDGIGLSKTKVKGSDLRFYISNVELTTGDGKAVPVQLDQDGIWQYKNLAMLDFEDGTASCLNGNAGLHKEVTGSVAPGNYTGVRFTLGVPFELDHADSVSAPSPLNMTAMFWNWQNGYKFLRAEVALLTPRPAPPMPETPSMPTATPPAPASMKARMMRSSGFPIHLGSTGCAGTSPSKAPPKECVHPNRPVIAFESFNPATDMVVFDLAKLLAGVDVAMAPPKDSGPGCMSFPEMATCKMVMPAFGLPFGDSEAVAQTVFSKEAKP